MNKGLYTTIWIFAVLVAIILGIANVWLGDLNQDEGWYLYASQMVAKGELPYKDFAFTQAPVTPFVYAMALPFVEAWGVLGGRIFTWLLALLGAGSAAWAAYRFAPVEKRAAALAAFILIGVNCYQSYFTAVVKTYSLSGLFLAAGFLFLSWSSSKRGFVASLLSGVLLALAAGTRISAVVVIPVVLVWLLWKRDRVPVGNTFAFALGSVITGALVFLPLFLADPGNFWFFNVTYHASRDVGSPFDLLVYKAGFLSRWARGYTLAFFIAVALGINLLYRRSKQLMLFPSGATKAGMGSGVIWLSALAVTIVHFLAPFPYEDYQVAIFPLFAIALAVDGINMISTRLQSSRVVTVSLAGLLLMSAISAFSSPINQDWMVIGRNLIWWRIKDKPDIVKLQEAGDWLREEAGRRDTVITQDTYLAVEAGLEVPHGMELGPFCYFPHLDKAEAVGKNVLNRQLLFDILENSDAPVAAFSEYGLAIASPEVKPLPEAEREQILEVLNENYECVEIVPFFGQGHTRLRLFKNGKKQVSEQ